MMDQKLKFATFSPLTIFSVKKIILFQNLGQSYIKDVLLQHYYCYLKINFLKKAFAHPSNQ